MTFLLNAQLCSGDHIPLTDYSKTFIGDYTRKPSFNTVIRRLLTQDRSVKFSCRVAPGVKRSIYSSAC